MTNHYGAKPKVGPSELLLWAVSQRHTHGETCKAIAMDLGLTPKTVQTWVKRKHDADELLGK